MRAINSNKEKLVTVNILDERLEKVDRKFDQVDKRFEKVDRQFDLIDKRFDEVDKKFRKIDQRFDKIDKCFERIDNTMNKIWSKLVNMETALGAKIDMLIALNDKTIRIEQRVDNHENDIQYLKVKTKFLEGMVKDKA